jgi:D-tyrosyl-tRNA(Tyr) deacylase
MLASLQNKHAPGAAGCFGADMQVALVNDGPVTFLLELD